MNAAASSLVPSRRTSVSSADTAYGAQAAPRTSAQPGAVPAQTLGMLINLAGRQRMLSQRIVLHAVLAAQGRPQAADVAREALELFTRSHRQLVEGGDGLPGLFSAELHQAYFGSTQADAKIREFMRLAGRVLDGVSAVRGAAAGALDELVSATSPVLALLQSITLVHEDEARRQAVAQSQQQGHVMGRLQDIARQAHVVSFNAQIIAARAGTAGREFSVVAGVLADITREMEHLVQAAVAPAAGPGAVSATGR